MRVPYALSVYGEEEINAVVNVLKEHRTILGKETITFEREIAKLFGKNYGVMVNSGSSANLLAVEVLGLEKGSEVVTPILTFSTTVAPLIQKNLKPVFVDVEQGTYLIDTKLAVDAISKKTKAFMIPSLLGNVPDYKKLGKTTSTENIALIEDSCDTLGAKIDGIPTGKFTDISTTSFYGSHIITAAGGGGAICVNDEDQFKKCKILRGWGRRSAIDEAEDINKRFEIKLDGIQYDTKFVFEHIGYNMLPLEISAAFGNFQLGRLENFSRIRNINFYSLISFFSDYKEFFILPEQAKNIDTTWLAFPLTINENAPFERMEIVKFLEENGIQTRPIFTGNILKQPGFASIDRIGFGKDFPNANAIMRRGFVVGCNQGLTKEHIEYMKDVFSRFLNKFL